MRHNNELQISPCKIPAWAGFQPHLQTVPSFAFFPGLELLVPWINPCVLWQFCPVLQESWGTGQGWGLRGQAGRGSAWGDSRGDRHSLYIFSSFAPCEARFVP